MSDNSARTWTLKAGVGIVIAGACAAGGFAVAAAASGPKPPVAARTASVGSKSSSGAKAPASPSARWPGGRFGHGMGRFGPGPMGAGAIGVIHSLGTGSFTLTTRAGTNLTVRTNSSTSYVEATSKVSSSALAVGERVAVAFTRPGSPAAAATTKRTAAAVDILLPSLAGQVLSSSGGTIVIADAQGFHRTIVTTSSTKYTEAGQSVPAASVGKGADIVAYGAIAADHTDLDATTIALVGPSTIGRVTKIDGTSITISAFSGGSVTISTSSSTLFRSGGKASSLAKVKIGDLVLAIGSRTSATGFSATAVRFAAAVAGHPLPGGKGWGRIGGPGRAPGFGSFKGPGAGAKPGGGALSLS